MNLLKSLLTHAKYAAKQITKRISSTVASVATTTAPARLVLPGPTIRHRGLTGLEIRHVRTQGHGGFPTRRMGRSKYMPDGIPARITKQLRNLDTKTALVA